MTDVELMRAAARGDVDAQRVVLNRVLGRVRTTVRFVSWSHPEQADIVQSALLELLRSARGFRGECSLETWADRIATHTATHYVSKRRRAESTTISSPALPEERMTHTEERTRERLKWKLGAMLEQLPPERRAVLVARYVYGYSVPEIAEQVQAPINTVRDRLRVGLGELREAWGTTLHLLEGVE